MSAREDAVDDRTAMRAAASASLALLGFAALTSVAFTAWLRVSDAPWSWKGVLTVACVLLSIMASALVWWRPRRSNVVLGIVVMLASLARIGGPGGWTWVSFALVAATFLFLMPLVRAVIVLQDDD